MHKEPLKNNSTNKTEIIVIKQYTIGSRIYNYIMLPSG